MLFDSGYKYTEKVIVAAVASAFLCRNEFDNP